MYEKRASINDVARRARVSISTVSRIISDTGYPVSASLRERVLRAAEELHYTPSMGAQGLRGGSTRVIGLIVRDISHHYFGEISKAITERALALGYLSFVCNTGRNLKYELQYHELLWQHRVRGIILIGGGIDSPEHAEILSRQTDRSERFGLRLFGIGPQGANIPSVSVDYTAAMAALTRYLIARGHRRIALITGSRHVFTSQYHLEGYRAELHAHGIPVCERLIEYRDFSERDGYEGCRALLSRDALFTGLCAGNDSIGVGAIRALEEAGRRVPEDVSIVGIGDFASTRYITPQLTTLRVPLREMGVLAVDMITGEFPISDTPVLLPVELVERDSVRSL